MCLKPLTILVACLACAAPVVQAEVQQSNASSGQPATGAAAKIEDLDPAAQSWLATPAGQEKLEELRSQLRGRTKLIVHLPSGRLAAPAPASLSEADDHQLALVIDRQLSPWRADVVVTTCSAREPFRIKGSFGDAQQGRQEIAPLGTHDFALIPVERALPCGADRMAYTMTVTAGNSQSAPVATSWTIRPVYHLATTFGAGFDFGKSKSYPVVNQQITETSDTIGLVADVGFTWFPWGVDYENMRWWNRFVNPFVLFKVDAITEGVKVGLAITPTGGISLGVGLSINKTNVLNGAAVGDTAQGEAPTRRVWSKDGLGLYVGILIDDKILKVMRTFVGGSEKSKS
jgi:hypothetical protein